MNEPLFELAAGLALAQVGTFEAPDTALVRCIYCGHECLTDDHDPYCSIDCGDAAVAEGE